MSRISSAFDYGRRGETKPCFIAKGTPSFDAYMAGRAEFISKKVFDFDFSAWGFRMNAALAAVEGL